MPEHVSQAVIGWGTEVEYEDPDNPGTWLPFHDVITADPPDEQADVKDVSHFQSPGRTKEKIQAMIDSGEPKFGLNWRPDVYRDHLQLILDKASGRKGNYRIVLPGGMETITFPAFVKGLKRGLAPNDVVTMDVTLTSDALTSEVPT